SSRRRHTRFSRDWSSDVCSSDLSHAIGQAWREHETQAAAGPARHQHQALAVMDQVFVARQLPELKAQGIRRRIGIRVELHHGIRSEERRVGKERMPRWAEVTVKI